MNKSNVLESRIGMKLSRIGKMVRAIANNKFQKANFCITPEQFTVLTAILDHDGLYQRQIGAITLKDRPNITRIIHILESSGLVTKTPDVNGRKVFKINITEKGKEVYKMVAPTVSKHWSDSLEGVTDDELESCVKVLDKIKANLEKKLNMQI
jgi:DNA-binding MarR family transcriptional regulator